METALHGDYKFTAEFSCDEVALVADGCRYREARNVLVRNDRRVLDFLTQFAQAAAEDDAYQRLATADAFCNVGGSCVYFFNSWINNVLFYV